MKLHTFFLLSLLALVLARTEGKTHVEQNLLKALQVDHQALQATVKALQIQQEATIETLQATVEALQLQQKVSDAKVEDLQQELVSFQMKRNLKVTDPLIFTKDDDGDWIAQTEGMNVIFPSGAVIVGKKNPVCTYGPSSFSVDSNGINCPSGQGSVTFGYGNTASGVASTVTGGQTNEAGPGSFASISGGNNNKAPVLNSSVSGGENNSANGESSSVLGGGSNTANPIGSTILGGFEQEIDDDAPLFDMIPKAMPPSPFKCKKNKCRSNKKFVFKEQVDFLK